MWNLGQKIPDNIDNDNLSQENTKNNFVKSPKFENLSDWTLYGTTNNSLEETSDPSGVKLYNNIHKSTASAQILKQNVIVNQTICAPIVISLWSKAELVLNGTNEIESAFLSDKFSIYTDLELQSGRMLWGYSEVLSISPHWQKTELKLDLVETLIKVVALHIMFKIPGTLWVHNVSVIETSPVPAIHGNASLALHFVPLRCTNIPEETTPIPLFISAVILNWKRPVNLLAIVCSLLHYPFLTEIIVWNNNRNFSLQVQHFIEYSKNFTPRGLRERAMILMNKIRIINSPNNVHDFGRWIACSRARNSICYIQDDDYEHCYINSLYANLQLNPQLVHSVTMPSINLEQRRWMLWNPRINLHASFAWLGAGSFVPKQLAQNFLDQLSHFSFEAEQLLYSDMLFNLWNNDPVYKLTAPLIDLFPNKVGFSDTHDHWKIFFHTINRGARILHAELSRNPFTKVFNHKQSTPLYDDRTAQAVCRNDKCILITNHQIFVPLNASVIYNELVSVREQDQYYPSPSYEWFDRFGYHNAVDGNISTMWQIVANHTKDTFYFGLDLLRTHHCQSIWIHTTNFTENMLKTTEIYTSVPGKEWKRLPVTFNLSHTDYTWKTLIISPLKTNNLGAPYRFFRVHLKQPTFPLFINEIEPKCSPLVRLKSVIQRKQRPMVTAVFISWIRLNGWSRLFSHISKYEFINEIIFWNNNPNVTFNHTVLYSRLSSDRTDISLKVINSNSNLYFFARFVGCSMAKNAICFFQDDDWQSDQLNALYQNYLQYPHLLHTYTNPFVHYLCWTWSYMDASVNMHTSFNWLGTGGLVSKQNVIDFIENTGKLLASDQLIFADMFFSTWFNDHHYQLSTNLNEITNVSGFSAGDSGIARNKYYILQGANILNEHLRSSTSMLFSREEIRPLWEDRIVRSPCFADNCLFITNMHAFPSPRQITTNFSLDFDGRTSQFVNIMPKQRLNDWLNYPYHHAVDGDEKTCYYVRNSSMGHYFGLDLFSVQFVKYIHIRYEGIRSAADWLKQFVIERTSDRDAHQWNAVNEFKQIHVNEFWVILSFSELVPMEMVRLRCIEPSCIEYKICHLSFIDDFNLNPCDRLCHKSREPCSSADSTLCQNCYCN